MAYRLIVAHDSPSIQKAIQMAFPASEFEIFTFTDGLEAMGSVGQIKPDAVLLNLSLPQKNGYEVAHFLKSQEEFNQASLFLLKGAFEVLDTERITGLSYDEIIEEPFDSERLARMVLDTIEGKRDPQTLPEEPLLDEIPVVQQNIESVDENFEKEMPSADSRQKIEKLPRAFSEELGTGTEERLRNLARQEVLGVEKELEKRLKTQVLADIKDWLDQELERIKKRLKHEG